MLDYINLPRLHNEGVIFMIILENDIVNIYIYFYVAMVYQFIYRKNWIPSPNTKKLIHILFLTYIHSRFLSK